MTIEAGVDLDSAVGSALQVGLNWPVCDECHTVYHGALDRCEYCGIELRDAAPPYSTDIAAAWLIVDHFKERHIPVSLYSMSHGVYYCFFGSPVPNVPNGWQGRPHEAREMHPAEAICRAALLYMEHHP